MTEIILYWSLAVIAVLITGISKSGFAGGAGAVAVPLLSLVMPPLQAIALMLPLLIIMDGFSVKLWWGQYNRKLLIALIPASLIGVAIGYATADQLSEDWIRFILGVIAIAFVLMQLLPNKESNNQKKPNTVLAAVAGASAGFTSFLAHAGGPPLNMFLLKQKLQRSEYLATAVYFFAAINLFKLYPYIALEQFNTQILWQGALLIPVALIGVALGKWLQAHLSQKMFLNIIYVLLFGLGCKLMYSALSELL
ncbi:sulfite exporter TauE/SafE family protein [Kangiella koreensis]|uniref:Probable membrane transporter protein n=1 Tax=Kangiella koreensis (strain DSM 16069 / JCM 12317 / KCTC 12182 / SW-125) TaxID=523791 RepID=C7RCY8_KANKD|nr:sulfite exporter TauE/SafE family protein [Kangiella koreensis]ACV27130.1 protein of unknown function DUF81 [Kangiella koreensis DSM 16069]